MHSKEGLHYTCIAAINIDSAIKIDKKSYLQVYLEECRYDIKKKKMTRFIDVELELDDSDSFDSEWLCFSCSRGTFYALVNPKHEFQAYLA